MRRKISFMGARLLVVFVLLILTISFTMPAQAVNEEEIQAAIDAGIAWLVEQQNPDDGSWGEYDQVGTTAFAVKKLEHHCVDTKWGLGLPSPFDPASPYRDIIQNGFASFIGESDMVEVDTGTERFQFFITVFGMR